MLIQKTCGVRQRAGNDCPAVTLRDVVRRLVVERGHLGVTNPLVRHEARCLGSIASSALAALTRMGEIHAAKVPGELTHWFASAELAARWRSRPRPALHTPTQPSQQPRQRMAGAPPMQQPTDAQNLSMVRRQQPGVTIWPGPDTTDTPANRPAHVPVQRGPGELYDPRYQCAPGARPFGAGFAAAGVGRDVVTGAAWAQA
jgi:hypothetical protein